MNHAVCGCVCAWRDGCFQRRALAGAVLARRLLRLGRGRLVGVVVGDLVLQLVVGQQVKGGALHLQLAPARATGGEADGAATPAGTEEAEVLDGGMERCATMKERGWMPSPQCT